MPPQPKSAAQDLARQAEVEIRQGRRTDALKTLGKVLDQSPDHPWALEQRILLLMDLKDYGEAGRAIEEAARLLPGSLEVVFQRGRWHFFQQQYASAVVAFEQTLALDPNIKLAHEWRIIAYRFAREFAKADEALKEAEARFPGEAFVLNQRGFWHSDQLRHREAVAAYEQALALDPNNKLAHEWRIIANRLAREFAKADGALKEAEARFPGETFVPLQRGLWHYDQSRYAEAAVAFDRVLALDPNHKLAHEWKIIAYRLAREFAKADGALREAEARLPSEAFVPYQRGHWHSDQLRYPEAVAAYERALALDPGLKVAHEWRIIAYRLSREFVKADEALKEAEAQFPGEAFPPHQRGYWHYDQARYRDAVECFDRALQIDPKMEFAHEGKINAFRRLRDFSGAQAAIRAWAEKLPHSLNPARQRSYLHHDRGDLKAAVASIDEALGKDPADEKANEWKVYLHRRLGNYEAADASLRAGLDRLPGNRVLMCQKGLLHFDRHEYAEAVAVFDDILRQYPSDTFAWDWKIAALRNARDFAAAARAIEEAEARFPKNPAFLNQKAFLSYDQGRFADAEARLDETLNIDPANATALEWRIVSLRMRRDAKEARRWIDEAKKRLADPRPALFQTGSLYHDLGQYLDSVRAFDQVLAEESSHTLAHDWKIAALRSMRDLSGAERAIEAAERAGAEAGTPAGHRALVDYERGCYREALGALGGLGRSKPSWSFVHEWTIASYFSQRDFREAERAIEEAAAAVRVASFAEFQRALWHYHQKDHSAALQRLEAILKVDPTHEGALRVRIAVLQALGKRDEAAKAAREALEAYPSSPAMLVEAAKAARAAGTAERAEELLERVLRIAPAFLDAHEERARCLADMGRADEGERRLLQLRETPSLKGAVGPRLAAFYLERGDFDKAEQEFRAAEKTDPKDLHARFGLTRVLLQTNSLLGAEASFRSLRKEQPGNVLYSSYLAWTLLRRSELPGPSDDKDALRKEAKELCTEALDRSPREASVYGCLGAIAFREGRYRECERLFQRATQLDARDGFLIDLARLYMQLERHDDAQKALDQAVAMDRLNGHAHVEKGNLQLLRNQSAEAIREFREALALDPVDERAILGMAIALTRTGALAEAGDLLKKSLSRVPGESQRWRLYLRMADVLTRMGDREQRRDEKEIYYEEALRYCRKAEVNHLDKSETCFVGGLVRAKLRRFGEAVTFLKGCLKVDPSHFDAERYLIRVQDIQSDESTRTRPTLIGGLGTAVTSIVLVAVLWWNRFRHGSQSVPDGVLIALTPLLLGLFLVGALLPWLSKLKLTGVEVELAQPKLDPADGPTGELGFESALASIRLGVGGVTGSGSAPEVFGRGAESLRAAGAGAGRAP